ncbi:MFS transporter [Streptomyces sp. NPDC015237]|uniref:MFS transporter n=1 Tax=Streptomyces sp. NPDC015237 TaxID=3364949 RepID=UPI0036FEFC4B
MALSNEPAPLYVLWQAQIGFNSAAVTLIYAGYIAGLLVALVFAGALADRYGRRPVLLPGLALGLVAAALFITAHSVAVLCLARLLSGLSVGAVLAAGMAAVGDLAPEGEKKLGGLIASMSMAAGAALGPLLTGVLAQTLPWPTVTVFVVQLGLLVTAAVLVSRMPLRHTAVAKGGGGGRWLRLPSAPPGAARRALLVGLAVFAPAITATGFVLSLGPSLLARLLGADNRLLSGGLIFLLFAAATGIQLAVRSVRVPALYRLGAAVTVAGMAALAGAVVLGSVPLLVCSAVLAGSGQGASQLAGLSSLASLVPRARAAEANAALTAGGYLVAGILPVLAGYLSDAVGLTTGTVVFGTAVAFLAVLGTLAAAASSDPERRHSANRRVPAVGEDRSASPVSAAADGGPRKDDA